jgi:hypothetical protein
LFSVSTYKLDEERNRFLASFAVITLAHFAEHGQSVVNSLALLTGLVPVWTAMTTQGRLEVPLVINNYSKCALVFISDDHYSMALGVALQSALEHNNDYVIYVIDRGISESNWKRIVAIGAKKCELYRITSLPAGIKEPEHLSRATFPKLLLPSLLPELDRVLCLDCDVLVRGSLEESWNWKMGGKMIGAVRDVGLPFGEPELASFDGAGPATNPQLWIRGQAEKNYDQHDDARDYGTKFAPYGDQTTEPSLLRMVFEGLWASLPFEWNTQDCSTPINWFCWNQPRTLFTSLARKFCCSLIS